MPNGGELPNTCGREVHVNIDERLNTRIFATTRRDVSDGRMYRRNGRSICISPTNPGPVAVNETDAKMDLAKPEEFDPNNPVHCYAFKTGMAIVEMAHKHCDSRIEDEIMDKAFSQIPSPKKPA